MRVVIDTNVLISGIFFKGIPYEILKSWQRGKFKLAISKDILVEYQRVSEELNKKFPKIEISKIIELITLNSEIFDDKKFQVTECSDSDDNKFLSCALAGNCKIIVSGDKHLLVMNGFKGLEILKPRDFYERFLKN